jgi:ParB family transcriptional regulator, chromosome partitioning protein
MTDIVHRIALSDIDADALPRDRTHADAGLDQELCRSILTDGLRQPVELFELADGESHRYGLIAGHRRLAACRRLGHADIAAFVRQPRDLPAALAAMVTENEIRAPISSWEKAALILRCRDAGLFPTLDAAIDGLFAALSRQKRARLRGAAMVAEAFDGLFATPEALSMQRIERLAAALRAGWDELLLDALPDRRSHGLASQWAALEPLIAEALDPPPGAAAPGAPNAPRRLVRLKQGLTIRRELSRSGWVLRFSGPEARSPGLMEDVMDHIERVFQPGHGG